MTGYCDAHNHLHDQRFCGRQEALLVASTEVGVNRWVVNGACEADWPDVAGLAERHPNILPAFGYHPWYLHERTERWQESLLRRLTETPRAVIGEIGLDRWLIEHRLWSADALGVSGGAIIGYLTITFVYYWWHRWRPVSA